VHKSCVLYYFWDYVSFPALSRHDPNYGPTLEDLKAAGCSDPPPPPAPPPAPPVCYRDAEGLTWDGPGQMPTWLKRAVSAGQSVEFFGVG